MVLCQAVKERTRGCRLIPNITLFSGEIHLLSHNQQRDGQLPKITKGPNMEKLKVNLISNFFFVA